MNVLLGVTGGIAAYKACDVVSGLKANGHDVKVVMTENALKFIPSLPLAVLSEHDVKFDMWGSREDVEHINLAKWADVVLIYPATANTIAKFAHGIADNLLTTIFLALDLNCPIFICPAMNSRMWEHSITQQNMYSLSLMQNIHIIYPIDGKLACGDTGTGKIERPRKVVELICGFSK